MYKERKDRQYLVCVDGMGSIFMSWNAVFLEVPKWTTFSDAWAKWGDARVCPGVATPLLQCEFVVSFVLWLSMKQLQCCLMDMYVEHWAWHAEHPLSWWHILQNQSLIHEMLMHVVIATDPHSYSQESLVIIARHAQSCCSRWLLITSHMSP